MHLRRLLGFALLVVLTLAPAASFAQFNQVPLISTSLGGIVSGTYVYAKIVSASSYYGDGSNLTGIAGGGSASGDRIVSGTTSMVAQTASNIISITTAGTTTGYFNANGVLTAPGISATQNLTSVTSLYASGKVGIGTPTPGAPLTVNGGVSANNFYQGVGTTGAALTFASDDSLQNGYIARGSTNGLSSTLQMMTAGAERMRITSGGNVGIKTAAPTASLDVSGSIRISTDGATCGSTIKGALQYTNQTLQVCDGVSWTSVASFPGTVPTTPGSGGIGYMVLTSATFTGNLGGLTGANAKCYTDLNTYSWKNKPGSLDSSKVFAFLCDGLACNGLLASTTYYFANAGDSSKGGAFFTTDGSGIGPGDNFQWDGSNRFGYGVTYWSNRQASSDTLWNNGSDIGGSDMSTCNNFTTASGGYCQSSGASANTNENRWQDYGGCDQCSNSYHLICLVHP